MPPRDGDGWGKKEVVTQPIHHVHELLGSMFFIPWVSRVEVARVPPFSEATTVDVEGSLLSGQLGSRTNSSRAIALHENTAAAQGTWSSRRG